MLGLLASYRDALPWGLSILCVLKGHAGNCTLVGVRVGDSGGV